eukprot:gene17030-20420_t
MELKTPYLNPNSFSKALVKDYNFSLRNTWDAQLVDFPQQLGKGAIQLFIRNNIHFFRGKWTFNEPTTFFSSDPVQKNGLIDFRLNNMGIVHSAAIEGDKNFEWDITRTDGVRLFLPSCLFSQKKVHVFERFQRYMNNKNVSHLYQQVINIDPAAIEKSILLESKILEFIYLLTKFLDQKDIEQHFPDISDHQLNCIKQAKELLDLEPEKVITIKSLSRHVGLNELYLKTYFKKCYGLSIRQYIIKNKMELAKDMLVGTDLPIQEISSHLGYQNRGHFASLYFKFFGINPLENRLKG